MSSARATLPAGIAEHTPLAAHTTFELGGPARFFLRVTQEREIEEALRWAASEALAVAILGGGSNLVVRDEGFPGLVLALRTRGVSERELDAEHVEVTAAAGEPWDDFVSRCVDADLAGVECLSGIPGMVGATPLQNVGAYGQEVADTLCAVRVLDRTSLQQQVLDAAACGFAYRDSALKRQPGRYVVLAVSFRLRRGGAPHVRYAELARALGLPVPAPAQSPVRSALPSLAEVRRTVLALRRAKSMVLDARDENRRSAGSFFLNPIVPAAFADALAARLAHEGRIASASDMPRFAAGEGRSKLAAAWLIERSGLRKGERRGAFGISSKHSLALVHHGGGSTRELLAFAGDIQARVLQELGVQLEREPIVLG